MKIGDIVRIKKTDETGEVTSKSTGSATIALKSGGNITLKFKQLEFVSRAAKIDTLIKNSKEKIKATVTALHPKGETVPAQTPEQVATEVEAKKVVTKQHSGRYSRSAK